MSLVPCQLWRRLQETPLELAIAALAVVAAALTLTTRREQLTGWLIAVAITLALGGAVVIYGRVTDHLNAESAGLALLIGSFLFLTLQQLPSAQSPADAAGIVANYGALVIGYAVRLYVIRKAVRTRMLVARERPKS
jgi:hypothetical protein